MKRMVRDASKYNVYMLSQKRKIYSAAIIACDPPASEAAERFAAGLGSISCQFKEVEHNRGSYGPYMKAIRHV
jgi:hypothetical protein